ncbi:TNF receptor-associated factor 6-B-like isoform X2 [Xenia sp. Carnegie-2017]|uniref:TNF receptor-associated factor 6-B-like isoform X2 n=1 Tax=Xenia sp. Carnegie-2017 TaxID=2897299 RepID=UPI001F04D2D3|nr:TNF receptor-associated factor 6-B-like isoform X2 [Xenia sp. Carnegie-2017]
MVGTKIRDEDRKNIHSKYIFTYCDDLLVNPIQTSCEHSFCQSCIEILLGRPNPKCTEDEEHLNRNNIFPNDDIKQELNCIVLHCPNEKCKWLGPYQELKGHIGSTCKYAPVVCPYCKDRIRRKDIEDHLNKFCRKIHIFPNDDIKQELNCIVLHCPNEKCKWLGPYQELKGHIGSTCKYAPMVCAYCKDRIRRKDIEDHLNKFCRKIHTSKEKDAPEHMNDRMESLEGRDSQRSSF